MSLYYLCSFIKACSKVNLLSNWQESRVEVVVVVVEVVLVFIMN